MKTLQHTSKMPKCLIRKLIPYCTPGTDFPVPDRKWTLKDFNLFVGLVVHPIWAFLMMLQLKLCENGNLRVPHNNKQIIVLFYRCEEIEGQEEENKSEPINQPSFVEGHWNFTLDSNYNLMRYNEQGEATRICDDENAIVRTEEEEEDEKMEQLSDGQQENLDISMIEPSEWVEVSIKEEMDQCQFNDEQLNTDQHFNFNY